MERITSVNDIKKLGTILGVWAHPDDETFFSSGIMAAAVKNGQKVICITATDGEAGVQDESKWPAQKLAKIRRTELDLATEIIGVKHRHSLGFKDGSCSKLGQAGVNCVYNYVEKYQPDTILTFNFDGLTGHDDHKAVCEWSVLAQKQSKKRQISIYHAVIEKDQFSDGLDIMDQKFNMFFNIDKPNLVDKDMCDIYFEHPKGFKEIKYRALKALESQTSLMMSEFDKNFIMNALSVESFVKNQAINYS